MSLPGPQTSTDEKSIRILLRNPALSFMQDLRRTLDADPQYLAAHADGIRSKVTELLSNGGIFWDSDIFNREWERIVKEALLQLRGIDK